MVHFLDFLSFLPSVPPLSLALFAASFLFLGLVASFGVADQCSAFRSPLCPKHCVWPALFLTPILFWLHDFTTWFPSSFLTLLFLLLLYIHSFSPPSPQYVPPELHSACPTPNFAESLFFRGPLAIPPGFSMVYIFLPPGSPPAYPTPLVLSLLLQHLV